MRKLCFLLRAIALVAGIALLSAGSGMADELYGRIRGRITDATGAAVPGVEIRAQNTDTGISKSTTSGSDGIYEFLNLPIGSYKVTGNKANFKTFTATGIVLTVNEIYVQNIALEIGQVSEQVMVEAAPSQVETTSMQLGTAITGKTIVDLPLNGRNWIQLQQLQPGVMAGSDRFGTGTGGTAFATNGSQSQQNSFLINGTDSNDLPLNTALVIPSPDAIAEFQMVTNTINPEYGRNSGAIVNAVIKSGTNRFHGSAFDFFRDTSLNARNFFQPKPSVFHQHQFGGTIGGPIWKDHTFGFFSYQGIRARQAQAGGSVNVFTSAQQGGVFAGTAFSKSNKLSPIPLFGDSLSTCQVGGTPCPAGTAYSKLFATGAIPPQDFNNVTAALMKKYVPTPNFTGNLFTFNPITATTADQYLYRIDHTFNSRDSIWFYNYIQTNPSNDSLPFTGSTLPGFPEFAKRHIKQYTAAWNHAFSASMLNEVRAGYTRFNFDAVEPVTPTLPSSAGFTGITPQVPSKAGLPVLAVTGLFTLGFTDNGPQPRIDQTYQFTDNFSKIVGKHSLKFGFEGRRFNISNPFYARLGGHYNFAGNGAFSTGNAGADYLLGFPDSYFQTSGNFIDAQAYEEYIYAQDQFKIRPNLTLTYGVGYQIDTPVTDRTNHNRAINCFRPNQQSAIFATAPAGLVFPGDANCTPSGYTTHYNNIGPRVGFAYSPNADWLSSGSGKLSIRGGFGIYYNRGEEELTLQNLNSPPFSLATGGIADAGGNASLIDPFTDIKCIDQNSKPIAGCVPSGPSVSISNKFPFAPPAAGSAVNFGFFEPMTLNVLDPNFRVPYAMNYNLTVERELPGKQILSVGYVGALGRHLENTHELNPGLNPAGCAALPACFNAPGNQPKLFPANFKYPGNIFGGVGTQATDGSSRYHSLQVSVNKSLSHGLSYLLAYTYSHSLDYGSSFENSSFGGANRGQNPFNPLANFGDSQFDGRHRFVLSYLYELPSARKIHGLGGIPKQIVDGWKAGGITTLQTGFPVDVRDTGLRSLTCDNLTFYSCWDVPNLVAPVQLMDPRSGTCPNPNPALSPLVHCYFTTASFARETIGTIGNAGRSIFHGPGIYNFDIEVSKDTYLTSDGTKYIELRLEMFNVWNHAQFNNPNNNINAPGTFGIVTTARDPRLLQLAAKFYF
jgi:hypothetical protein